MTKESLFSIFLFLLIQQAVGQNQATGKLFYSNSFLNADSLMDWKMEGQAEWKVENDGLHLYSPQQSKHHVLWCPISIPADFIAEWEAKNLNPEAGLCIIFFAACGKNGEDIFSEKLMPRKGIFKQYTQGDINNYHISYYANNPFEKRRNQANLRKNIGFKKVQSGELGIPKSSTEVHHCKLISCKGRILFYVDQKKVIDWTDSEPLGPGKIGFRQMKWTHFVYRNFKVWEIKNLPAE